MSESDTTTTNPHAEADAERQFNVVVDILRGLGDMQVLALRRAALDEDLYVRAVQASRRPSWTTPTLQDLETAYGEIAGKQALSLVHNGVVDTVGVSRAGVHLISRIDRYLADVPTVQSERKAAHALKRAVAENFFGIPQEPEDPAT